MTISELKAHRARKRADKARAAYYADVLALPPEADVLCPYRPCFNKYEDRGGFSYGRGYTSAYTDFKPVCATRLCQGCPAWRRQPDDQADRAKAEAHAAELEASRSIRHRKRAKAIRRALSQATGG